MDLPYLANLNNSMERKLMVNTNFVLFICLYLYYFSYFRDSHREVTLFWAGSLLNMYVVLLPALVTREFQF